MKSLLTQTEIKEITKTYIQQEFLYDKPEFDLEDDFLLIEEDIIDSLGIFVLIRFLDEQFQVKLQPDEVVIENFANLNTLTCLVMSKLNQ